MTALAEVVDLAAIRSGGVHVRRITVAEVAERVEAIRSALAFSIEALGELREAEGHLVAFGADCSWHEACERWFGDLRSLRLAGSPEAVVEREALVRSIRATGASTRAIRERLGVSAYAVAEALRDADPAPETVVGADGRTRAARTGRREVEVLPAPVGRRYEQAAEYVRRAGAAGLDLGGVARVAGWSEGAASGALARAMRAGLVVREDAPRGTVRRHYAAEVSS